MFYLDDGTLGGSLEEVLRDVCMVERVAGDMGLQLNHRKSEIICDDPATRQSMLAAFPQFCVVSQDHATLLGSPVGNSVEGIEDAIGAKTSALALMGDRLRLLYARDGFCLLRNAFTLPKMLYTLRTAPRFLSSQLQKFNDLQRSLLADIANISLDANDRAWAQAVLPVWSGGLGVRSASQLAPSAFLASAAGSSELTRQILPPQLQETPCLFHGAALALWSSGHDDIPTGSSLFHSAVLGLSPSDIGIQEAPGDCSGCTHMGPCLLLVQRSLEHGFRPCRYHLWVCAWTKGGPGGHGSSFRSLFVPPTLLQALPNTSGSPGPPRAKLP